MSRQIKEAERRQQEVSDGGGGGDGDDAILMVLVRLIADGDAVMMVLIRWTASTPLAFFRTTDREGNQIVPGWHVSCSVPTRKDRVI